eukprot:TRINITY_DN11036_c0_g1_i4.p2 TRINITY_DN11036_c0_g1~~TRINITY_DN11036_c0_g1_i4.p2  ORF type:complete len:283 (+),score=42.35 TRINITY_DN11036_c0_g1_i4:1476-2324(+)
MAQRLARFRALAQQQRIRQLSTATCRFAQATPSDSQPNAQEIPRTIPQGLFKFFPQGKEPNIVGSVFSDYAVGRRWLARDLRLKSNEDLHKLWYVLLIEKNKLLTIKHECRRQGYNMPRPDRFRKIRKSMEALKTVVQERELVLRQAKTYNLEEYERIRANLDLPIEYFLPKPERLPLRPNEEAELLGVVPPNRPRPGQKMRPMSKREKTKFRKELRIARQKAARKEATAYADELKTMTDDQILLEFRSVVDELLAGHNLKELSLRSKKCLAEARERGLSPV